jgi:surface carbohydrate biosynthesis protein
MHPKPPLIIPVENQVRELDPKLLLACVAARRGFTSIIGSHREIDFRISQLPLGLYLNKSMTDRNLKMFRVMRWAGHRILTWDEEALVHLPPDIYYPRRLSPAAIRYVSHLFAWGEDNAELWRRYPHLPPDLPIHVTGNPRNDMLRPELHPFYAEEVRGIRRKHGDFFLINTNFNHVNAFFPAQNLFKPVRRAGRPAKFGKAGVGMTRAYAEGLRDHKQAIFEAFQRLIPRLAADFPGLTLVVRPHPTESQEIYRHIAAAHPRVHVTNEGNVVPWLLAAKALIHNGCTTGVEAFVMRVPAVSYCAVVNETYDNGFYLLPNCLSHAAFSYDELQAMLQEVLDGRLGAARGDERQALVRRYLAAQDGPLACERLMDVLEKVLAEQGPPRAPALPSRALGAAYSAGRFLFKKLIVGISSSHAPPEFHRHRFPGIDIEEVRLRIARFREVLNDPTPIHAKPLAEQIFSIGKAR